MASMLELEEMTDEELHAYMARRKGKAQEKAQNPAPVTPPFPATTHAPMSSFKPQTLQESPGTPPVATMAETTPSKKSSSSAASAAPASVTTAVFSEEFKSKEMVVTEEEEKNEQADEEQEEVEEEPVANTQVSSAPSSIPLDGESLERKHKVGKLMDAVWKGPNVGALKRVRDAVASIRPLFEKKKLDFSSEIVDELLDAYEILEQKRMERNKKSHKRTTQQMEESMDEEMEEPILLSPLNRPKRQYQKSLLHSDEEYDEYETKRPKKKEVVYQNNLSDSLRKMMIQLKLLRAQFDALAGQLSTVEAQCITLVNEHAN